MKKLIEVTYQITDKGIEYPEKTEEITVDKNKTVDECLKKLLNKYRLAMCLSRNYSFKVVKSCHIGYAN